MLELYIPAQELMKEDKAGNVTFIDVPPANLRLEHSLVSLAKWERKWNIPFLSQENLTVEQTIDYIRCMTITQNVSPEAYLGITNEMIMEVKRYIDLPMTAAWFNEVQDAKISKEAMTAESFYYFMIELNIPIEFQKWHLNSLLALIKFINVKHEQADPKSKKKRSPAETMAYYDRINEERRKKHNSKG